jgi:hypothetical protein
MKSKILLGMMIILYPIYFGFAIKNSLKTDIPFKSNISTDAILKDYIFSNNNGNVKSKFLFFSLNYTRYHFKGLGLIVLTLLLFLLFFWDFILIKYCKTCRCTVFLERYINLFKKSKIYCFLPWFKLKFIIFYKLIIKSNNHYL